VKRPKIRDTNISYKMAAVNFRGPNLVMLVVMALWRAILEISHASGCILTS
jgi:hypothetical protein